MAPHKMIAHVTSTVWTDSSSLESLDAVNTPKGGLALRECRGRGHEFFAHGRPMCISGWLSVRKPGGWVIQPRLPKFVKLHGEVLSICKEPHSLLSEEYDMFNVDVRCAWNNKSARTFRLQFHQDTLEIKCKTYEEMIIWAKSIQYASHRSFHKFYTLGKKIGSGRHSKVYFAHPKDPGREEVYAVKVIRRSADIELRERIEREIRIASSLAPHNNIVAAVDVFATSTAVHIVMEHMKGETLASMVSLYPQLPEMFARPVMQHVFDGLAYIHGENVVHRDIRLENIFCSEKRFPMELAIGDFGTANIIADDKVNRNVLTTLTIADVVYIAPEMAREQKYGASIDLWSAGVMMYRILSGGFPFVGRDAGETLRAVRGGEVSMSGAVWTSVSPEAKSLIRQLLQVDPFKRISAQAAANHVWLKPQLSKTVRPRMTRMQPLRKLVVATIAVISVARLLRYARGQSITLQLNRVDGDVTTMKRPAASNIHLTMSDGELTSLSSRYDHFRNAEAQLTTKKSDSSLYVRSKGWRYD